MDKLQLRNFVDGQWRDAADGRSSDLVDPVTGEVYASAPLSGETDVDAAYGAAARAFETWRDTTPAERQRLLLKLFDDRLADGVEQRMGRLRGEGHVAQSR